MPRRRSGRSPAPRCIAKFIIPSANGRSILGTLLLGIIGAFVGGSLAVFFSTGQLALTATTFSVPGIALGVVGAVVAVFLWRVLTRRTV